MVDVAHVKDQAQFSLKASREPSSCRFSTQPASAAMLAGKHRDAGWEAGEAVGEAVEDSEVKGLDLLDDESGS